MVGRSRYSLPLSHSLEQKFAALADELDVRVLASSGGGGGSDPRFALVRPIRPRRLDGLAFYVRLPFLVARELRGFGPDAVLAQGAQEAALAVLGRKLARMSTRVIADIHGDPAAPTRLYGSPGRRALAPLADALARHGLRSSDGIRTISAYTSGVVRSAGVEPTAEFAAFMDLEPFVESPPAPLPETPAALFVGVLERYKAVDVLAEAWRIVAPRVPEATLHLVGRGTLRERAAGARARPAGADALDGVAPRARGRTCARRRHGPRPAVPLGGARPRDRRGVLPRAGRGREPRRRDSRHRRRRRDRPPGPFRGRRLHSPTRSSASSRIARSPSASGGQRMTPCSPGWRPRRSTRGASARLVDAVTTDERGQIPRV